PRNLSLWQFDEACEKCARRGRVEAGVGVGRTAYRVAMTGHGHDQQLVVDELRAAGVMEALTAFAGRIDVDVEHEPARAQRLKRGRGQLPFGRAARDPMRAAA